MYELLIEGNLVKKERNELVLRQSSGGRRKVCLHNTLDILENSMSIYKTSYETTLGSAIQTKVLERSIKEAVISDSIDYNTLGIITSEQVAPIFVLGTSASESNIPLFAHPLMFEHKGKTYLCSDVRLFVRQSEKEANGIMPKNRTEFNFVKSREVLNLAWLCTDPTAIKYTLNFAATVYSAWISEVIAKRFALDPKDQLILTIIAHYFFQSLHHPEDIFDEETRQIFAVHTMKATRASSQFVFEVFDNLGKMSCIEDFCENVKKVLENVRLKDLNPGTLITAVNMSWFGTNAKEITAVALEHPPTWYAMVFSSLEERTFKNSMIARVAERYGKGGAWIEFKKAYVELVGEFITAEEDNTRPSFKQFQD